MPGASSRAGRPAAPRLLRFARNDGVVVDIARFRPFHPRDRQEAGAKPAMTNVDAAHRNAPQIFAAVSGICSRIAASTRPARASASTTALTTAGVAPIVPSSPTPLAPSGLFLH